MTPSQREWRTACLARRAFIAQGRQDLVQALDEAWAKLPEVYSPNIVWSDADAQIDALGWLPQRQIMADDSVLAWGIPSWAPKP